MVNQKFNPFAIPNETHCGDCDILMSDKDGRYVDIFYTHGIRCPKCHFLYLGGTENEDALKRFGLDTCCHCGSEYYVESLEACASCSKPGCQRCLAGSINLESDQVIRWHTDCKKPKRL